LVDANILAKDLANSDIHFLIDRELPMITDTSERGLERLICTVLTGAPCDPGAEAKSGNQGSGLNIQQNE